MTIIQVRLYTEQDSKAQQVALANCPW